MKNFLEIVVLHLLLSGICYAGTIFEVKSKNKDSIIIEAFEPTNHTETINNKINFKEIEQIAFGHCKTENIDWTVKVIKGGSYNGVYQAGRDKSVVYDFKCIKNSSVQNSQNNNTMQISKQTCLDLGFTAGTEKFGDCVLKIMDMNNLDNSTEQKVAVSTSNETQDQQYTFTGETNFSDVKKNNSYYKKLTEYMKMPEKILCIGYINGYGLIKKRTKQAARFEAITTRKINCNPYTDVAYYDKEQRRKETGKAVQELWSGVLQAESDKHKAIAENYRSLNNSSITCRSRKSGSSIRTTCY